MSARDARESMKCDYQSRDRDDARLVTFVATSLRYLSAIGARGQRVALSLPPPSLLLHPGYISLVRRLASQEAFPRAFPASPGSGRDSPFDNCAKYKGGRNTRGRRIPVRNFMTDLINEGSVSVICAPDIPHVLSAGLSRVQSIIEFPDEADWTSAPPEVARDPLSAYTEYLLSSPWK